MVRAALEALDIDIAKVTSKGQVTIPKAIRNVLGLRTGDKVLFNENADGTVTMRNANVQAFKSLRESMEGAAEEAGLKTEEDVVAMVREMHAERRTRE